MPEAPDVFGLPAQTELIERLFESQYHLLNGPERRLDRIQIEHQIVRIVQVLDPGHPGILLDIAAVRDVEQLLAVGADEIADIPGDIFRIDLLGANPLRRVIGCVFLIKGWAINPTGKPLEDEPASEKAAADQGSSRPKST